jgi:hypothetical protein
LPAADTHRLFLGLSCTLQLPDLLGYGARQAIATT